jgi:cell division septal protein FtsQ
MAEAEPKAKEHARRLRARNWALFAVLAGVVLLFYLMTIVRMGEALR